MDNSTAPLNMSTTQHQGFADKNVNNSHTQFMQEIVEPDIEVDEFIYRYVGPVFLAVGLIGNTLTCIVLRKPPLNNFSPSIYLFAYSLFAVLTILFSIGLEWCEHMFSLNKFSNISEGVCRVWAFLTRIILYAGVWFITGSSIDRFIALWLPYKAQDMCNVFIAKFAVVFILTGVTVVGIHAVWIFEFTEHYGCIMYDTMFNVMWGWVSTLLYTLLPQTLIFLFGNLLIVRLCLKHRGRQIPETATIEMDLTYTVMVLSMVHFLFSFPATVAALIDIANKHLKIDEKSQMMKALIYSNYLLWVGYSALFFILLVCCKAFREGLTQLFVSCLTFIKTGSTSVELEILTEDYDQVPSTSTSL